MEVLAEVKAELAAEVKADIQTRESETVIDKSWWDAEWHGYTHSKSGGYEGWKKSYHQTGGWSKWKQWDDKSGWFLDDNSQFSFF